MVARPQTNARTAVRAIERVMKQVPYATSQAINTTALGFQAEQRGHMLRAFHVRRRQWVERNVKIRPGEFARRDRLRATVRIEAPGQGRSDILSKFEDGGIKRPEGTRLAIPDEVPRTGAGIVRKGYRPRQLDFQPHGTSGRVFRGDKRTVMIRNADGTGAIYQRTGRLGRKRKDGTRGRGAGRRMASSIRSRRTRDLNLRLLYRFTPRARIDDRLDFVDTAQRVVRRDFEANFEAALQKAIEGGLTRSERGRLGLRMTGRVRG